MLQWVGGMGLIILVVAIMPTLGIGGGQLFKMEVPSFESSQRLTPRITQNAKALWQIYLFLTISCLLAYLISGMELFDAFAHALSTVAIGGFSTHDASIGYFDSFAIEVVCIVFMLMSATSFSLHYAALYERKFLKYLYSEELKFFLSVIAIFLTLTIICFATFSMLDWDTLRKSIFQTISIITTSGFTVDDYSLWPGYIPFLLLVGAFIGACSGSVGGGLKSWRVLMILDQARQEIIKTIHPNAVVTSRIGKKVVDASISEKVWGFFAVYVITFIVLLVLVLMSGLDFESSFSAVGATLNNLGPGLGEVASNYESLSSFAKIVLSLAMILGRLEIFTLLVLLTPAFWKR
jgi:trk system potassium uptake protein TrkH